MDPNPQKADIAQTAQCCGTNVTETGTRLACRLMGFVFLLAVGTLTTCMTTGSGLQFTSEATGRISTAAVVAFSLTALALVFTTLGAQGAEGNKCRIIMNPVFMVLALVSVWLLLMISQTPHTTDVHTVGQALMNVTGFGFGICSVMFNSLTARDKIPSDPETSGGDEDEEDDSRTEITRGETVNPERKLSEPTEKKQPVTHSLQEKVPEVSKNQQSCSKITAQDEPLSKVMKKQPVTHSLQEKVPEVSKNQQSCSKITAQDEPLSKVMKKCSNQHCPASRFAFECLPSQTMCKAQIEGVEPCNGFLYSLTLDRRRLLQTLGDMKP